MKKLFYILAAFAPLLSACGDGNNFKIEGTVAGAGNEKMTIQRSVNGFWITADTITTDGTGDFAYEAAAPEFPEIYRLERKGRFIYFPIDSLDRLTLTADTAKFDSGYTLAGTDNAVWMMEVDKIARSLSGKAVTDPAFKNAKLDLTARILQNPSSIVAFYTVEKRIDGHRLFAPENKEDLKIIGAVATGYQSHRSGNPLAKLLEEEYIAGIRLQPRLTAPKDTILAEQIGILDIELKDEQGTMRKLSSLTGSGKVILLNFTSYMAAESPDFNRMLAAIHTKFASRGFDIYQIGYGDNEFEWKDAAENLPWTTVYDPAGLSSQNLIKYNVATLPCVFIIGRDGTISERVLDINDIEQAVARQL